MDDAPFATNGARANACDLARNVCLTAAGDLGGYMRVGYAPLFAAAVVVSGCSANTFKDTITNFDTGVTKLQQTAQLYSTERRAMDVKFDLQNAAAIHASISFDENNCHIATTKPPSSDKLPPPKCVLSDPNTVFLPDATPDAGVFKALTVLKDYSSNLLSVVNATTVDDLNKAESSVATGLKNVGTDIRPPPAPGVKAPTTGPLFANQATEVGAILQPVLDEVIEHIRIEILRKAVDQADPLIQGISAKLQGQLGNWQTALLNQKVHYVHKQMQNYRTIGGAGPTGNIAAQLALQDALTESEAVQALISFDANIANLVTQMAAAHAALKKTLDDPDAGVEVSSKSVFNFASEAAAALAAAQKFSAKK